MGTSHPPFPYILPTSLPGCPHPNIYSHVSLSHFLFSPQDIPTGSYGQSNVYLWQQYLPGVTWGTSFSNRCFQNPGIAKIGFTPTHPPHFRHFGGFEDKKCSNLDVNDDQWKGELSLGWVFSKWIVNIGHLLWRSYHFLWMSFFHQKNLGMDRTPPSILAMPGFWPHLLSKDAQAKAPHCVSYLLGCQRQEICGRTESKYACLKMCRCVDITPDHMEKCPNAIRHTNLGFTTDNIWKISSMYVYMYVCKAK